MYIFLLNAFFSPFPIRDITLLMTGLDNAGKTCTVKHLLGGKLVYFHDNVLFSLKQIVCSESIE